MNASHLIMEFLPLIIYIGVDAWKGFRAGIIAAMICTIIMAVYHYLMFGQIDKFLLGEGLMILVLGTISLKMNNDRYFKFQPPVLAAVFSAVFAWFQVFDQPLMLHFIPQMEKIFQTNSADLNARAGIEPHEESPALQMLHSEEFRLTLSRLSGQMIWLFAAHGILMAYAALRLRTAAWFAWRLAIYPALFVVVIINQILV
ncbi:septation protein IspZ [Oligoflexus tunisiensis]|uniref:septation protein IspZ n=1 Tax=Oligoflexus tunisiensis TaxID=708132 RepID=UPI00114D0E0A|nr:septation protein IspZ [Oligoflexus tunisiensis]